MKKPLCNPNLPEWARGWLAGIIDGEGTITIEKKQRKDSGNINYMPLIIINNTNLEFLKKIKEICRCGTVVQHSPSYVKKHPNWNPTYRLEIKGSFNVKTLLKQVYPYLIIKRKHAEIVMRVCEENIRAYSLNQPANTEYLEKLFQELKSLTRRGRNDAVGLDSHP